MILNYYAFLFCKYLSGPLSKLYPVVCINFENSKIKLCWICCVSTCVILDLRREVSENCFLWTITQSSGNSLQTFRDTLSVPSSGFKKDTKYFGFLNPEDGTDRFSRNVGKKLPLLSALWSRRAQSSFVRLVWIFQFRWCIHVYEFSYILRKSLSSNCMVGWCFFAFCVCVWGYYSLCASNLAV